jgi:enterochelin esterase family protein
VLYLFHGLGGNEREWAVLGKAQETLDRLIGTGKIKPLLVVMPMAGDSWYVDDPHVDGAGPVAQAITRDLVQHVEQRYPAAACRAGRAVGGLSMGGYGALLYAMDQPDRYAAAFSLSGAIFRPMPENAAERAQRPTHMFRKAFGSPFDWRRFNDRNLFTRLSAYVANPDRPPLYLVIADNDFPGLIRNNTAFQKALEAEGISVPFRIAPGSHDWRVWASELGPALEWLDAHLSSGC